MKRTYIALTTANYQTNGYHCIAAGNNKQAVEQAANDNITGDDIYAQTHRKNLRIVSKTAARKLGFDWNAFEPVNGQPYTWVE